MYALGRSVTHGVSDRCAFQFLSNRHITCGNQNTPPSYNPTFNSGYFANTPSVTILIRCAIYVCGNAPYHPNVVIGCPTAVAGADIPAPSPPTCNASGNPYRTHAS